MRLHMYCVKTSSAAPRIGEAVKQQITQAEKEFSHNTIKVVAVIPRVLKVRAFEYEVIEADVLLEVL